MLCVVSSLEFTFNNPKLGCLQRKSLYLLVVGFLSKNLLSNRIGLQPYIKQLRM